MISGAKSSSRQPVADRFGQRVDIDGILVIGRDAAQLRAPSHSAERFLDLVGDARRRRPGILRIERDDEHARAALGFQLLEGGADRGRAVAHRPIDDDGVIAKAPAEPARRDRGAELFGLRPRHRLQRAFVQLPVPDRLIVLAARLGAPRQNDEIEDRPPDQARRIDHAPVGQEFLEIAPHRPVAERVGRAEIDQQDADLSRMRRNVVRRRGNRHEVWTPGRNMKTPDPPRTPRAAG